MPEKIRPKKSLGQNFLRDGNTARKIVASLGAGQDDAVVEIGAGTGALTGILDSLYSNFSAVEIDGRAVSILQSNWPRVRVIHLDVLKIDWPGLSASMGGQLHVIGNLPYNITSQIIFGLLDAHAVISEAVLMMQYEVAQRLVASPRTREYGILSVAVQLEAQPRILFPVSRNVFFPKPDVRSAVIHIDFSARHSVMSSPGRPTSGYDGKSGGQPSLKAGSGEASFVRRVVRTAFNQRRKTLRNSLSGLCDEVGKMLPDNVSTRRAEELSPQDFLDLARYLQSGS
jgi:16S rRNA (adenine1518-N6/adenine1519-N6)-dimethyltransferase